MEGSDEKITLCPLPLFVAAALPFPKGNKKIPNRAFLTLLPRLGEFLKNQGALFSPHHPFSLFPQSNKLTPSSCDSPGF